MFFFNPFPIFSQVSPLNGLLSFPSMFQALSVLQFVTHGLFHMTFLNNFPGSNGSLPRNLVVLYFYLSCLFVHSFIISINMTHFVRDTKELKSFHSGSCMCLIPTAVPCFHPLLHMAFTLTVPSHPLGTTQTAQTVPVNAHESSLINYFCY